MHYFISNTKTLVFTIIIAGFLSNYSFAQLRKGNFLLGISGTYETDNKVAITSLNFEYENFDFNSSLLGIGASVKYCNFAVSYNKKFFLNIHTNLNFTDVLNGALIPFVGLTGGTNLKFSDNLYGAHIGCRVFTDNNILIFAKYGLTNRSLISPEIGIDVKF